VQIQQISNHGTTNPIVARLCIQIGDLLPFFELTESQRQEIFGLMFSDIQPTLLTCFTISDQLRNEIRIEQKKIDDTGLSFQGGGRHYTVPTIFDLRTRAHTFLYHAKCVLRDMTKLFNILFSKDFENAARYDKVIKWAEEQFGADADLTRMLKDDEGSWIRSLVKMRNAVEHPGGYSGTLYVENFTAAPRGNQIEITEPLWYLNDETKSPIAFDMPVYVDNLLTFCEQTLLLCLDKFKKNFPLVVAEIPESERDPHCPIRYKMTLDTSKISISSLAANTPSTVSEE